MNLSDKLIFGVDGEGQGRNPHNYTFLAAATAEKDRRYSVQAGASRLFSVDCLDFFLLLPKNSVCFAYSFNYDITKMLTDVDDKTLYHLARSEMRNRGGSDAVKGPAPELWEGENEPPLSDEEAITQHLDPTIQKRKGAYSLNLVGTKLTIKRGLKASKNKHSRIVWDIFKFYQSKFVTALTDWKVGTPEEWARMTLMKDKRAEFEKLVKEGKITEKQIREYCFDECGDMARLAEKLIKAHVDAGIPLTKFYGPGSSAGALLTSMNAKELRGDGGPLEMAHAIASAFFGGRFENSVIGPILGRVWNYDISSAYPYQQTFLPCLLHGKWAHTKKRAEIESAQAACVSYSLHRKHAKKKLSTSWGPFPFRERDGSICFPITSGGGWVWKDEFLAGEKLFDHVRFREAWVYHTECDCGSSWSLEDGSESEKTVFGKLPGYYLFRIRIGKEGPGIVIKLAINSCYGKLAQSVGNAAFNSWIWAGMITSGCRAQILEILGRHKDRANLLMVATDGIYTRERLDCLKCDDPKCTHKRITPRPRDTGTWVTINDKGVDTKKPLGGWEEKEVPQGVFVARPGIYFPRNPTEEQLKEVRGRGVGKGVVLKYWGEIERAYAAYAAGDLTSQAVVPNLQRFCGMKTSISRKLGAPATPPLGMRAEDMLPTWEYTRASGGRVYHDESKTLEKSHDAPHYGEWVERQVMLGFSPLPKRSRVHSDGVRLVLRSEADLNEGVTGPGKLRSMPYSKAKTAESMPFEALDLARAVEEALEQPDADLEEWSDADDTEGAMA